MSNNPSKQIHYNEPQLRTRLVAAQETYCIWARGTGKSTGALAPFSLRNILTMPKSNGILLGATYEQILLRTLAPLKAGWEMEGFKENVHFFIRKFAPKKWKWDKAYITPDKPDYYIHFFNGSGIYLVSLDRSGSSNGLSVDWIMGDEAKLLKKDRLDEEVNPTLRGNHLYFGKLYNHRSKMFTTDMPKNPSGQWILDKEQLVDREHIDSIMKVAIYLEDLKYKLLTEKQPTIIKRIQKEIKKIEIHLNEARKGSVYVDYANAIDNIDVLSLGYIKDQKRDLSDLDFRTSILNMRITQADTKFYVNFDDEYHTYTAPNYSYIDGLYLDYRNIEKDCRWDSELDKNKELDIALDYNAGINSLVCGQEENPSLYRILSSFFVKYPEQLKHVVQKWCDYYKYHKEKKVNYYYDHTAVGRSPINDLDFKDVVIGTLEDNGWVVEPIDVGQASSHASRHIFFTTLFKEDNPLLPRVTIHSINAESYIESLNNAGTITEKGETKKDKRPEKNKNIPQEKATHLSDAGDCLLYSKFAHRLRDSIGSFDAPVGT
ncbi:hypothetical protein V9L05_15260 [Bernardetia sp. Wsw4-3y2]|uniref:hypothetical protein n=1 Tax=Bernardetia sp. Wsw4-3y2 TaxID=3127471 RepID=UPI0030D4E5E7